MPSNYYSNYNLEAKRGDSLVFRFTFTYADTGLAVNISNWTIWFTLKKNEDDTDNNAIVQKQFTTFTDPTNGKTTITAATPSETNNLLGKYLFDVQYKDNSGTVRTPDYGTINFSRDITRVASTSSSSSSSCRSSSSSSRSA